MTAIIKYHRDIHLPRRIEDQALDTLVKAEGRFRPTRHALDRAHEKGVILPERIPVQQATIIEATVSDGKLEKFLLRFPSRLSRFDVVMSYTVDGSVPTVYHNRRNDGHRTLDRSVYALAS